MKLQEKDIPKLLNAGFLLVKRREYLQINSKGPKYAIMAMDADKPQWYIMETYYQEKDRQTRLEILSGWSNVLIIEN